MEKEKTPAFAAAPALCGAALLGFWQPLFAKNGYYDIVSAKAAWVLLSAVWLALLTAAALARRKTRACLCRPGREGLWLAGFAVLYAVSAACAGTQTAWLGVTDRYNGALLYLSLTLCYFVLCTAPGGLRRKAVFCALEGAALAAGLLTLADTAGADPLGFFAPLAPELRLLMTSTLGNRNFAAVLYLLGAALSGWQLAARPCPPGAAARGARGFLWAVWAVCAAALLCCGSDGALLAFGCWGAAVLCQEGADRPRLARCAILAGAAGAAAFALGVLLQAAGAQARASAASWLLHPAAAAAVTALCLAGAALLRRKTEKAPADHARAFRRGALAVLIAAAALAAAANLLPGLLPPAAEKLLALTDSWGSSRGYVWKLTPALFAGLSPLQKLVGAGPDGVAALLNPAYTDAMAALNGQPFDSMHNEYLQILLCGGVLGLTLWAGALAAHLRAAAASADPLARGAGLAAGAYLVQAAFNVAMPVTTPALYLLLACCGGSPDPAPDAPGRFGPLRWQQVLLLAVAAGVLLWPQAAWLTS